MARSTLARYQLPAFFALAFAITWPIHIAAYTFAHNRGLDLSNEGNVLALGRLLRGDLEPGHAPILLLYMFSFGPTVAGLLVTALVGGRAGLADLLRRAAKVRIPPAWIARILLLPLALAAAAVPLGLVMGGLQPLHYDFLVPLSLLPALLAYMLVFTGLAEEVGWRGYALPALQRRHTAERSSWILGIAWGLWHLPAIMYVPFLRGELTPALAILLLSGLTVGVVGWTIVLTWIYNNTQSVFWIIMLHGWNNTVQSYVVLSSGSYTAQVAFGALPWAVALYLLKRYGPETLAQRQGAVPFAPAPPAIP